jgi:tape measure domain-containing protein
VAVIDELKILVTAEVAKAISDLDKTEKQTKKTGDSFGNFAKQVAGYTTGMNLAVDATKKIISGMFNLAKESLSVASGIERTQMEFGVLLGDLDAGASAFADMNDLAAETPLAISDITSSGKQLLSVGISVEQVTDTIRMLGDVAMGDAGKLGQLTSAFAQLKSKGVASMEQINRFTEAGIPIIKELATNFGVTEKEVFNLVSTGKVGFKDVEGALKSLTGEGGLYHDMMKQVAETTAGKWSTAQDNFRMALGRIGTEALPVVNAALDAFNAKMDASAEASKSFKEFHEYMTSGNSDEVDAQSALAWAIKEVEKAERERAGASARYYQAADKRVKDAEAIVKALAQAAYWQGIAAQGAKDQAATDAAAAEKKAKAEANRLRLAEAKKLADEAALKNTQEMDKAYAEWGDEVISLYGASSLLNPLLDETAKKIERIKKDAVMISDAWGDWDIQIGETEIKLSDAEKAASSIWDSAGNAYSAYNDLVKNGQDLIMHGMEEEINTRIDNLELARDKYDSNSSEYKAIDEQIKNQKILDEKTIKDKKNEFGQKQFDAEQFNALASIAINTAVEASKVLAIPGAPYIIGALGIAQAAMVLGQKYVPYASGGYVDQPTHALVGEAGGEWILNKTQMAGLAKNGIGGGGTTIIQNISGSIWNTKSLESMAISAQAKSARGF